MTLHEELAWRGLIKDKTFEDDTWLDNPKTFYHGIDGSADSLHIGNLAPLMLAWHLMNSGWKAVLLVGGATSLVGDPGGKDTERELKSKEEIESNVAAIKSQAEKLFNQKPVTYVNNIDWFGSIGYLDFLRDVGKHYSMTELVQRDYIAQRMGEQGSGISYAEFSYTLIQGYDFWYLYKNHQAILQVGGSDQWGNMLSGVPLIRKKENAEAHVMTIPLVINKTTGRKFGKSEEGAVWLDPAKTSPTQFYQFWINVEDENVADYLKIYTLKTKEEVDALIAEHSSQPEKRLAQQQLAREVTWFVHGEEEAEKARVLTEILIGKVGVGEASDNVLEQMRREVKSEKASPGASLVETLVKSGLASSNSEARRLIESNAVYINGNPVKKEALETGDFQNGRLLLRRGKAFKDSALIELV